MLLIRRTQIPSKFTCSTFLRNKSTFTFVVLSSSNLTPRCSEAPELLDTLWRNHNVALALGPARIRIKGELDRQIYSGIIMSAPQTQYAPTQSSSVLGGQIVGRSERQAVAPPAALKLRLDLNLEVEIAIQAKVNGDITLSLL